MKLAFDNVSGDAFSLSRNQFSAGCEAAKLSRRRRIILPIHRVQDAPVQRMMNYLQPGTYIRPHKHPRAGASESLVLLQGSITFFVFDHSGVILQKIELDSKKVPVLDIEPNVWHTFVVTEPDTVLFESKMGPYDLELDKTFAVWAPEEFTDEARQFLEKLEIEAIE